MGVLKRTRPLYMVATQVKTLMAENRATNMEREPKIPASISLIPATNMWCPQVKKPTTAMPIEETAMAPYELGRFREKVHTVSLTTPMAGRIMMYTAGCE